MMLDREKIIARLFSRTALGMKFDLERIRQAASGLGNPQDAFASVHVAGTNGKGSVCAFLESILRSQGYRTGLFTSPHLVRFEERFIINGKPVETGDWLEVYAQIENVIEKNNLTFFEISTLLAFELFRREKVEWAVIEVGLGGRLDATNIIKPAAAVIANIGIDHREYLGNDIISIAREKLGIVKKNVPVVMARHVNTEVVALAQTVCSAKDALLYWADIQEADDVIAGSGESTFMYKNIPFSAAMPGRHQIVNALCAFKTAEVLNLIHNKDSLKRAILETKIPARFQRIQIQGKTVVFDVAHNPQAAEVLCNQLKAVSGDEKICITAGIMADKDYTGIIRQYSSCAATLVFTRPRTPRAADTAALACAAPPEYRGKVICKEDVGDAVAYALENSDGVVCVTGSFYTVGEAMTWLKINPYP